jgi:hypothetical protein
MPVEQSGSAAVGWSMASIRFSAFERRGRWAADR